MAKKKKRSASRTDEIKALRIIGGIFGTLFSIILTLLLIFIITGGIVAGAFAIYCRDYLIDEDYDIADLKYSLDMTSKIYYPVYSDIERTQLVEYVELEDQRLHGSENRYWAPIQNMPNNLKNAFIAIEDKRFYEHGGFDFKRTAGAVIELAKGNKSYGGSTITQQLIKNITGERDTTIQRKVTEIFRAMSLTEKRTKDEVLEMYLNTIPLSHGNYGVAAAANYFFDKEVSDLTLVECAALASIPKSPTKYSPELNPDENKERRRVVLTAMRDQGLINEEEYLEAWHSELVLNINREETVDIVYSYFTDELRRSIQEDLMEEYGYTKELAQQMILSGGLRIYATVDPYIQNILEEAYMSESTFKKVDDGVQPESAMVVLDPYTGQVLGIVGGRGEKTDNMTLNRATMSRRQIGSAIKPVSVYAPAMDMGIIDYGSVVDDTPLQWTGGRYWPKNAPATYEGKTTVERALMVSKNTVAARLVDTMTPQYVYDFMTKELCVESLEKADIAIAPLALGGFTYGMTTLEVAGCYTMLASQTGIFSEPRFYTKVLDSKGNVILNSDKMYKRDSVISEGTSKMMTKLMTSVVSSGGTAKKITLKNKINVAAKTGTTNDNKDVYFVGYTPYYLGATWFGYDQPRSLAKFGDSQAMVGWEKVMTAIHERVFTKVAEDGSTLKEFDYNGLVAAKYCKDSGLAPGKYCELDVRGGRIATGYYTTPPTKTCDVHYPVEWDTSTGSVASGNCPSSSVVTKALVLVGEERMFEHSLKITDAKYTMMTLPENYSYPWSNTTAIFENMLNGKYYGYTAGTEIPPNSYCTVHAYSYVAPTPDSSTDYWGSDSGDDTVIGGVSSGEDWNDYTPPADINPVIPDGSGLSGMDIPSLPSIFGDSGASDTSTPDVSGAVTPPAESHPGNDIFEIIETPEG